MKQETMGCQWHQLDRMQIICTSLQTDNHASTSSLITCRMLFLTPNKQRQSSKQHDATKQASSKKVAGLTPGCSTAV